MIKERQSYKKSKHNHLPVWCQVWYLDAVCGAGWDCRFMEKDGVVQAVWVFGEKMKWGLRSINFPTFLKYNGLFFGSGVMSEEKDEIGVKLMEALPRSVKMSVEFMPGIAAEVPSVVSSLEERAYAQKWRTTYVWEIGAERETLWRGMDGNYRRMINKQLDDCVLRIESKDKAMEMYDFHTEWVGDLREHGVKKEDFNRVLDVLYERESGEVLSIYRGEEKIASVLLLRDVDVAYYLLAVNNKEYKKIYPAVLMAEKVRGYASEKGVRRVDFLGSDIESISRVWRKLGAEKHEYLFMNKSFKLPFNTFI